MAELSLRILALRIGKPRPFREDGTPSTLGARQIVHGPVMLEQHGFVGDQVADETVHGGADKAVHHYFYDHYGWWRQQLGDHKLLQQPGAFGENISTKGAIESELRIGDRFRMGKALVEISHGRQPCWKLDHHFGVSGKQGVLAKIIESARCGIYLRVIEPGPVAAGDLMQLVEKGPACWTVDRVFKLLIAGGHREEPETLAILADFPQLALAWRKRALALAK